MTQQEFEEKLKIITESAQEDRTLAGSTALRFKSCDVENKMSEFWFDPVPFLRNGYGGVHGGATATAIDEAIGFTSAALSGRFTTTVDLTISYPRPMMENRYILETRIERIGEHTATGTVRVIGAESGETCALGQGSFFQLKNIDFENAVPEKIAEQRLAAVDTAPEPEEVPEPVIEEATEPAVQPEDELIASEPSQEPAAEDSSAASRVRAAREQESPKSVPELFEMFVGIMETYFSKPVENILDNDIAEALMKTVIRDLRKISENPSDKVARSNLEQVYAMAGGVYPETGIFDLAKRITSQTGFPVQDSLAASTTAFLRDKMEARFRKLIKFSENVWGLDTSDYIGVNVDGFDGQYAFAAAGIAFLEDFIRDIGLPSTLAEVGTDESIL